jgi:hypothetical protein
MPAGVKHLKCHRRKRKQTAEEQLRVRNRAQLRSDVVTLNQKAPLRSPSVCALCCRAVSQAKCASGAEDTAKRGPSEKLSEHKPTRRVHATPKRGTPTRYSEVKVKRSGETGTPDAGTGGKAKARRDGRARAALSAQDLVWR